MSYNFTRILPKIGSSTSEKKYISTSKMTLIQQQNASIDGPGFLSLPIDTRPSNGYEHSSRWSRHDGWGCHPIEIIFIYLIFIG